MIAAVVPMKPLAEAKQRLSPLLSVAARHDLVTLMLREVLECLRVCPSIKERYVVTADPNVAEFATRFEAKHLPELRASGLNEAVQAAATHLEAQGMSTMLFLPGDVPLITPAEIDHMIAAAAGHRMVAVPAHDADGTNALLLSPPQALDPAFGSGSFQRHMQVGRAAGLDPISLQLEGVARDIDRAQDLICLAEKRRGDARYAFLRGVLSETPLHAEKVS